MSSSMSEAADLIEAAKAASKIHSVVQNRRFISGVRRMRRFVESGAIGDITAIHCDFFIGPHFGGFREKWTMCCFWTWRSIPSMLPVAFRANCHFLSIALKQTLGLVVRPWCFRQCGVPAVG